MSRHDVVSIGELLIDLVPLPDSDGSLRFVAKPGGAPANVAVGVARLGGRSAMLTKVGQEAFGRSLVETLRQNGVSTEGIRTTGERRTGLAVVTLSATGDRDFFFYRDGCADSDLRPEDLDMEILQGGRVLHVGSLFLAQATSAAAQRRAIEIAKAASIAISADPNLRADLWADPERMLKAGQEVIRAADVVKVSEEELALLTGIDEVDRAVRSLWHEGLDLVAVTRGPKGAEIFTRDEHAMQAGFKVETVDTIGCGDAFTAMMLTDLIARDFHLSGPAVLQEVLRRACAAGALTATRTGGMESLPDRAAIEAFLAARGVLGDEGLAGRRPAG